MTDDVVPEHALSFAYIQESDHRMSWAVAPRAVRIAISLRAYSAWCAYNCQAPSFDQSKYLISDLLVVVRLLL